jgi:hypothetical protein
MEPDGVVVARSAFESSFRYRSAAIFGSFEKVSDADKACLAGAFGLPGVW